MNKFCLAIILSLSVFSAAASAEEPFDGHAWLRLPKSFKSIFLTGYLNGYSNGYIIGQATGTEYSMYVLSDGFDETAKSLKPNFKETKECTVCFEKKMEVISLALSLEAATSFARLGRQDIFKHITTQDYYVNEVDAFLETYPLCKRNNMYALLFQLTTVWSNTGKEKQLSQKKLSYKDIGNSCLEE